MTGKEAFMQILHAEGVEYVFGIPGATEVQFVDVMEDHPEIKYVLCMHELAAVGMAEGYARTSGKVGFLNLHTGTGLAAGMPMLSNAWWGGVPLVVTVGQQDTRILAEEAAMSDDLVKIAAPFTKWATEVIRPEDLPTIMRRAFKIATHPPTGPVMVSLPMDVLADTFDFEYQPSSHSYTQAPSGRPLDRSRCGASRRGAEPGHHRRGRRDQVRGARRDGPLCRTDRRSGVSALDGRCELPGPPSAVHRRHGPEQYRHQGHPGEGGRAGGRGGHALPAGHPHPQAAGACLDQDHPDRQQSLADRQELPRRLWRGGRYQGGSDRSVPGARHQAGRGCSGGHRREDQDHRGRETGDGEGL